ncbi:MAG: DMT family transporter [Hyphomicrobiaceae bacterium]
MFMCGACAFGAIVSPQNSATLAMLGAVLLWSSATPTSKFALAEIAVGEFVLLRLALAAFALWLLVIVTRTPASLRGVGWRPLVMGLLEPGLVTLLVAIGLTMTSPVSGSVFWSLMPLLMPLLGRFVLGEPLESIVLLAAVLAFGGTMILICGQTQHGGGSVLGDLFVASGVLTSAISGLLARRNAQAGANPLATSSWQLTAGCAVAAALAFVMSVNGGHAQDASVQSISALIYLGLVVSVGVYILSNYATGYIPVGRMSLLTCLGAPVGAAISTVFLSTPVSALDLAGIAVVVFAVALPSLVTRKADHAI